MALFGKRKKEEKRVDVSTSVPVASNVAQSLAHMLRHARITEKASMHQNAGIYTFDVAQRATKRDIIAAVRALYKVTPVKIAIVPVPSKSRRNTRTGKQGISRGGKKAYVYLKKGETINL